jgi:hypothetical protein
LAAILLTVSAAGAQTTITIYPTNYSFDDGPLSDGTNPPPGWLYWPPEYPFAQLACPVVSTSGLTGAIGNQCLSIGGVAQSGGAIVQTLNIPIQPNANYQVVADWASSSDADLNPGDSVEMSWFAAASPTDWSENYQGAYNDVDLDTIAGGQRNVFGSVSSSEGSYGSSYAGYFLQALIDVTWNGGGSGTVYLDNVRFIETVPWIAGDANGDGQVDINDLTVVLSNYGQTGAIWSQGEFTGSGTVDINDLTIVLANYGQTSSAAGVKAAPEPGTLLLLGAGLLGLLACAWRKRRS